MTEFSPRVEVVAPQEQQQSSSQLRVIANKCTAGSCPTVYAGSAPGRLVVQGYVVPAGRAGVEVPEGEMLVEIPVELLTEAFHNLP